MRRSAYVVFVLALVAAAMLPSAATARTRHLRGCAGTASGGSWPMYGHDLSGRRTQPAEHSLGPKRVPRLRPKFVFSTYKAGGEGIFQATPIVARGCAYMGTSKGWVFSLNADTGKVVWKTRLPVGDPGLLGVGVVGSVAVSGGRVFAIISQDGGPYAAALSQRTGRVLWKRALDRQPGAYNDASPVVFRGMVFAAFASDESQPTARGGFDLLSAKTGRILAKTYVIPTRAYKTGSGGAGLWATAAIDPRTRHAYLGTGNPSTVKEDPRTDAILKVDVDRRRKTFGRIVDYYRGTSESLNTGADQQPVCQQVATGKNFYAIEALCIHTDVDFGASPALWRDRRGRRIVGELQKSGVYHAAFASTMKPAWTATIGAPAVITNGDTAAVAGGRVFAVGTPPGQLVALDDTSGKRDWLSPTADAVHFQGVTYAAGVVYTVDSENDFRAFDAKSGKPLLIRPLGKDDGFDSGGTSYEGGATSEGGTGPSDTAASVSVARHTVYVATGGDIVAYKEAR
jgi:outer membrane protein assembly factor BamB